MSLREKCPNPEFFLVRIFLYSDQKKTPYLDTFHAVCASAIYVNMNWLSAQVYNDKVQI